jgi:hypothetical protein
MAQWDYCRISFISAYVGEEQVDTLQERGFEGAVGQQSVMGTPVLVMRVGTLQFTSESSEQTRTIADLSGTIAELERDGWLIVRESVIGAITDIVFKRPISYLEHVSASR